MAFSRWDAGEIGSGEANELIHQFEQGPARDLFVKYNPNQLEPVGAHAIVGGILDRAQAAPEMRRHLKRAISFYESQRSS